MWHSEHHPPVLHLVTVPVGALVLAGYLVIVGATSLRAEDIIIYKDPATMTNAVPHTKRR